MMQDLLLFVVIDEMSASLAEAVANIGLNSNTKMSHIHAEAMLTQD